jgi:hypothetical protein
MQCYNCGKQWSSTHDQETRLGEAGQAFKEIMQEIGMPLGLSLDNPLDLLDAASDCCRQPDIHYFPMKREQR